MSMPSTQRKEWDKDEELEHLRKELIRAHKEISRLQKLVGNQPATGERSEEPLHEKGMWLFGYGSLIYNPGATPYDRRTLCYIRGYKRRFYQGSTDHRGTPESPGRVVTVLPADDGIVWGFAYHIPEEAAQESLEYLNYREKDGYEALQLPFYLPDGTVGGNALVYAATSANQSFLGKQSYPQIAAHIQQSRGPSGTNFEYFSRMNKALVDAGICDAHLYKIKAAMLN